MNHRKLVLISALAAILVVAAFGVKKIASEKDQKSGTSSTTTGLRPADPMEEKQRKKKQKEEARKKREEFFKQAEIDANKQAENLVVPLISLDASGQLTKQMENELQLTPEESKRVSEIIAESKAKEKNDFLSRAKLISGVAGTETYEIRAKSDKGENDRKSFLESISSVIGPSRSKIFESGLGEFSIYGGFGRYDVQLAFSTESGSRTVEYKYLSPESGGLTRYGKGELADENNAEWDVFDKK